MNWFEKWMLIRTLKKIISQGGQETKITSLYHMILVIARHEYNEDNDVTVKAFLDDCYNGAKERDW